MHGEILGKYLKTFLAKIEHFMDSYESKVTSI